MTESVDSIFDNTRMSFLTLPFNSLNHNFVFRKSGGTMVQQATTLIQQGGEYWLELSIGELASNN